MDKRIHFFASGVFDAGNAEQGYFGVRGRRAAEFAALRVPILPCVLLDSRLTPELDFSRAVKNGDSIKRDILLLLEKCGSYNNKQFGGGSAAPCKDRR